MLGLVAALPAQADPELDFTIPDSNPKATVTCAGGAGWLEIEKELVPGSSSSSPLDNSLAVISLAARLRQGQKWPCLFSSIPGSSPGDSGSAFLPASLPAAPQLVNRSSTPLECPTIDDIL
jgi:hypothetical protein